MFHPKSEIENESSNDVVPNITPHINQHHTQHHTQHATVSQHKIFTHIQRYIIVKDISSPKNISTVPLSSLIDVSFHIAKPTMYPIATVLSLFTVCVDAFTPLYHHNQLSSTIIQKKNDVQENEKRFNQDRIKYEPFSSLKVTSALQSTRESYNVDTNKTSPGSELDEDKEMPWSTSQEWALQDKILQYTVNIPSLNNPTLNGGGINKSTFVLWHTMRNEVTELMGYEITYLLKKYSALIDDDFETCPPPGILPFIDEFEFRKNGGIKGRIYGLVGIESGTEIVTSPLKSLEQTLPKGFVLTDDGSCAYELGIPKSEKNIINMDSLNNMMDGETPYSMDLSALAQDGTQLVSDVGRQSELVAGNVVKELGDPETSQMIVNLGTTTAVLFGAATAMNMLSHHMTVNVFWV